MRKSSVLLGFIAAITPALAFAQVPGGIPMDSTNDVKSASIGTPGATTDPMSQYLQQKSLNNLPGQQNATKSAGKFGAARPATAAELIAGATVSDNSGAVIAKIETVEPDGVVVSTATGKVKIPADAFGHNKAGLLLGISKAQFDQVVAQAK